MKSNSGMQWFLAWGCPLAACRPALPPIAATITILLIVEDLAVLLHALPVIIITWTVKFWTTCLMVVVHSTSAVLWVEVPLLHKFLTHQATGQWISHLITTEIIITQEGVTIIVIIIAIRATIVLMIIRTTEIIHTMGPREEILKKVKIGIGVTVMIGIIGIREMISTGVIIIINSYCLFVKVSYFIFFWKKGFILNFIIPTAISHLFENDYLNIFFVGSYFWCWIIIFLMTVFNLFWSCIMNWQKKNIDLR